MELIHVYLFEGLKIVKENFVIEGSYITLGQFLKSIAVISSGGMAKPYLATYPIQLNGQIENRRGKKLYPGDEVDIHEEGTFVIISSNQEKLDEEKND